MKIKCLLLLLIPAALSAQTVDVKLVKKACVDYHAFYTEQRDLQFPNSGANYVQADIYKQTYILDREQVKKQVNKKDIVIDKTIYKNVSPYLSFETPEATAMMVKYKVPQTTAKELTK